MRWWLPTQRVPTEWKAYVARQRSAVLRKANVNEVPILVLDTETSGLDTKTARILSLGVVPLHQGKISVQESQEWVIQQSFEGQAADIHGLTGTQLAKGEAEEEVFRAFLQLADGAILVGHHVGFDRKMLSLLCQQKMGFKLPHFWMDTARLAERLELGRHVREGVDRKQFSLDALAERYHIHPLERHTALGDAYTTALLLLKLLGGLRDRGVERVQQLL